MAEMTVLDTTWATSYNLGREAGNFKGFHNFGARIKNIPAIQLDRVDFENGIDSRAFEFPESHVRKHGNHVAPVYEVKLVTHFVCS